MEPKDGAMATEPCQGSAESDSTQGQQVQNISDTADHKCDTPESRTENVQNELNQGSPCHEAMVFENGNRNFKEDTVAEKEQKPLTNSPNNGKINGSLLADDNRSISEFLQDFGDDDEYEETEDDTPESLSIFIQENIELGNIRTIRCTLKPLDLPFRKAVVDQVTCGKSALFLACEKNAVDIAKYFLEECDANLNLCGAYDNNLSKTEIPPLWHAAVEERLEILKLLLKYGAEVNTVSGSGKKSTAVHAGCIVNNIDIVAALCEAGADVNIPNSFGATCLKDSVESEDMCKILIEHGADVNYYTFTQYSILHCAIKTRDLETVAVLVDAGADISAKDFEGNDCIRYAALQYCPDIVEYLMKYSKTPVSIEADIFDLLGAVAIGKSEYKEAYEFWIKSVFWRTERGAGPTSLKNIPSVLGDVIVPNTIPELIALVKNCENMEVLALSILNHQLGTTHAETVHKFLMHAASLLHFGSLIPALEVSIYSYRLLMQKHKHLHSIQEYALKQIVHVCEKLKLNLDPGDSLPKIPEMLSIFSDMVDHIAVAALLKRTDVRYFEDHEEVYDKILLHVFDMLYILKGVVRSHHDKSSFRSHVIKLVDCDPRDINGDTLLHKTLTRPVKLLYAQQRTRPPNESSHEDLVVARELIYAGVDVGTQNIMRDTPLHAFLKWSSAMNYFAKRIIKMLLDCGAHLDVRDIDGVTVQSMLDKWGVDICPIKYTRLQCLATNVILKQHINFRYNLPVPLQMFIDMHK